MNAARSQKRRARGLVAGGRCVIGVDVWVGQTDELRHVTDTSKESRKAHTSKVGWRRHHTDAASSARSARGRQQEEREPKGGGDTRSKPSRPSVTPLFLAAVLMC
jgi:hypothetical protein